MLRHPMALADVNRIRQFSLLATKNVFTSAEVVRDPLNIPWIVGEVENDLFGISLLTEGWHFDPAARSHWQDRHSDRLEQITRISPDSQLLELRRLVSQFRFGPRSERLIWTIHQELLRQRSSTVEIAECFLRKQVWPDGHPKHWRGELKQLLGSLSMLHVCDSEHDHQITFGEGTAILTHFKVRNRGEASTCPQGCLTQLQRKHGHVLVNAGRGLLGCLESIGDTDASNGIRHYQFTEPTDDATTRRNKERRLRSIGKGGNLTSIYLPAKVGVDSSVSALSPSQHRLLQCLFRERGRCPEKNNEAIAKTEAFTGSLVPPIASNQRGKRVEKITCDLLRHDGSYCGFNGNRVRKGRGYRLSTWSEKCGYESIRSFLRDLKQVADHLSLIVAAIDSRKTSASPEWLDLERLIGLERARPLVAARHHVRVYTESNFMDCWNRAFGWDVEVAVQESDILAEVNGLIISHGLRRSEVADALGIDRSAFSKMLNGNRRLPETHLNSFRHWIVAKEGQMSTPIPRETSLVISERSSPAVATHANSTMLEHALTYLRRGWSVIPQIPGRKQPPIKWKPFQTELPSETNLVDWWQQWPDAGVMLIAGRLSGVFAVDVDSPEARDELIQRLGDLPAAPTVRSGSGLPGRFHLFFQHPDFRTKAKSTPWHPKLEFRGHAGLIVLPPSRHKSGNSYEWMNGRSLADVCLPELPSEILETLNAPRPQVAVQDTAPTVPLSTCSPVTQEFLRGEHSNGPNWNSKLFNAACDLNGRGVPLSSAEPILMNGAIPWDVAEAKVARETIASAYSQRREPSQV